MSDELAKPDSVMDDLRAVADSLASNEPIEPAAPTTTEPAAKASPVVTDPSSVVTEPKSTEGRDKSGRFAPKAKGTAAPAQNADLTAKSLPAVGQPAPVNGAAPRETPAIAPATPPAETLKAPPNWKPAAREKWAALPAEVQQEAIRVDREVRQVMQETAEFRKHHQAFQAAVGPFEGMIRAEGGEPMQAIGSLLQTAAALRTAPAHHKAQIVAQIVKTYGVDVRALDAALVGEAPPEGQQGQGGYQDPRVDQLLAQINQAKQAQAQSVSQRTAQTIQDFAAKSEFFEDLREEMGDIMRVRGERGIAMSLEDAYNHALKLHPEISGIVEQRAAAEKARNANASTQRVRNAASSVKSQPAGGSPPRNESGGTVMDDVREAWAQLNNR